MAALLITENNSSVCQHDKEQTDLDGFAQGRYLQQEKELLLHRTVHEPQEHNNKQERSDQGACSS